MGTNDAYTTAFNADNFKFQFAQLIQKVKRAAPQASILLTTPGDCAIFGRMNVSNQKAVQKIKDLADESDCAVWDLFSIMGGLGSVNKWLSNGLSAYDKVHFSGKGYKLQGDLFYDALIMDYAEYCLKK